MAPRSGTPTRPLLVNGHALEPNTHVYVSAPWSRREGEPYLVARIMAILPALPSSPSSSAPSSSSATGARVRVAYYLRPRDLSNRYADHRLLFATMSFETLPAAYVRGICTVQHKESIPNMDVYKRQKDTFYFSQLYDRYLHRYFDAVPTDKVQNAPAKVVEHLVKNFEYIICETGMSAELCNAQHGCTTCFKWASNAESVKCGRCAQLYHLACLDPPLARKPSVGYSWSCAPCSKEHDELVESYMETGIAPVMKPLPSISSGKSREKDKRKSVDKGKGKEVARTQLRTTNGWPFRYFGMHTDAYSVLDPHDSLYPRASTRLGNKFQAVVPDWDGGQNTATTQPNGTSNAKNTSEPQGSKSTRGKSKGKASGSVTQRGDEEAVKLLFQHSCELTDAKLDALVDSVKRLPAYKMAGVDLIDRGLSLIKGGDTTTAITAVRKVTQGVVGHPTWTEADKKQLAVLTLQHGNDVHEIARAMPAKKTRDVVKRYYIDVGHSVHEDPQQIEEKVAAAEEVERKGKTGKGKKDAKDVSDDEGSVCGPPATPAARRARICAVCTSRASSKWYRCPELIGTKTRSTDVHVMCEDCGVRWRHYGMQFAPTEAEAKAAALIKPVARKVEKVELEPTKKEIVAKPRAPPSTKPAIPPKPCVLCKKLDPQPILAQCVDCSLAVHTACYGIPEDTSTDRWRCDLCALVARKKPLVAAPHCVLCPIPTGFDETAPLSALDCLKPTEQNNYIHLLCSVWHPEIHFTESSYLVAEALCMIPEKRRLQTCSICNIKDGACISCTDCKKVFHVSCAWTAGYKFGFEMQPLKKKRAKEVVAIKFKDEDGTMQPSIWCPDHHISPAKRTTYDLATRDPRSKLTALQTYILANSPAADSDSFPLLRRARRLDTIIESVLKPVPGNLPNPVPLLLPPPVPTPRPTKRTPPAAADEPERRPKVAKMGLSALLHSTNSSGVCAADHSFVSPSPPPSLPSESQPDSVPLPLQADSLPPLSQTQPPHRPSRLSSSSTPSCDAALAVSRPSLSPPSPSAPSSQPSPPTPLPRNQSPGPAETRSAPPPSESSPPLPPTLNPVPTATSVQPPAPPIPRTATDGASAVDSVVSASSRSPEGAETKSGMVVKLPLPSSPAVDSAPPPKASDKKSDNSKHGSHSLIVNLKIPQRRTIPAPEPAATSTPSTSSPSIPLPNSPVLYSSGYDSEMGSPDSSTSSSNKVDSHMRRKRPSSPADGTTSDEALARGKRPKLEARRQAQPKNTSHTSSVSSKQKATVTSADVAHPAPLSPATLLPSGLTTGFSQIANDPYARSQNLFGEPVGPPTGSSGWKASGLVGSAPLDLSSFSSCYDPPRAPSMPFPLDPALGGLGLGGGFGGWDALAPASVVDRGMSEQ